MAGQPGQGANALAQSVCIFSSERFFTLNSDPHRRFTLL
jgi:hypothetical protein